LVHVGDKRFKLVVVDKLLPFTVHSGNTDIYLNGEPDQVPKNIFSLQ
jgi:hypothetical protein